MKNKITIFLLIWQRESFFFSAYFLSPRAKLGNRVILFRSILFLTALFLSISLPQTAFAIKYTTCSRSEGVAYKGDGSMDSCSIFSLNMSYGDDGNVYLNWFTQGQFTMGA